MLAWWGRTVVKIRWLVVGAAFVLVGIGVGWGSGVFSALGSGGFNTPDSESARAAARITAELGNQQPDVVVLYAGDHATVDDPDVARPIGQVLRRLRARPEVAGVVSYYDGHDDRLVSANRHATYAAIRLRPADEDGKLRAYRALRPELTAPGLTTRVGGTIAFDAAANDITERDITRGEMYAMPIVLVLLVIVFGSLVAASMPLLIGGLAVLGALTVTRLIATVTGISSFAINSITVLGLGMAIDYSLFVISRFREELRARRDTAAAIAATMATAGRTVAVSAFTIALALASLLIFPQVFLRSMAFGGMAAVLIAMAGALTVLPAVLALIGTRIDALEVPWRRRPREAAGWARLGRSVMRRPVRYVAVIAVVLAVLALPLAHIGFSGSDERVLPAGTESRVTAEQITALFHGADTAPIQTLVEHATPDEATEFADRIRTLPGVTEARVTAAHGSTALVSVAYRGVPTGTQAHRTVRAIRNLAAPSGARVLVGGRPAEDVDLLDNLGGLLPWMGLIMAAVTLVVLFFAFGSVLLPIKAVVMNLASIAASFGVIVWIFQDGHLAGLLHFTPTGFLEPNIPIFILAVLFGLSTDYEVFLLSRIREEWDTHGRTRGDNTAAVVTGMQRSAGIITAAALLLLVVLAGFTTGSIVFTKMIGIGMITAILIDAALVRALLVPATMRLFGRWNWWAPGPLARLYQHHSLRQQAAAATVPADSDMAATSG